MLLVVSNVMTVSALTIRSSQTQTGTQTEDNVTVGNSSTYTIDGNLTVNGSFYVYDGSSVIVNGTLTVVGAITVAGNVTVNGKVSAGSVSVNNTMTVNSGAVLHTYGDLDVGENGSLTLAENSTTIIEGDLNQTYTSFISWLVSSGLGDVNAQQAIVVIGGDYNIDTGLFGANQSTEYIDPSENPNFYVFGENDLDKVGVSESPKTEANFNEEHPTGLDGFVEVVLPIELVYFEVYNTDGQVFFKWQTASELNNDYFTIEYSSDAVAFKTLATVQGSGTTDFTVDYDYQYQLNYVGTMYYRLKQTDYDGKSSYSKTEVVTFAAKTTKEDVDIFNVYPNPAVDFVTIDGGEYESVAFVSADGRLIEEQAPQSRHNIEMLPDGINIVIIRTANGNVSKTIVKQ